jgi:hypothetical protein
MMSKRSEAIEVMKANEGKSMADVVKLIAERIGVTEGNAKSYYKWIVQHGMAPGEVVKSTRAKAEPKAKAAKAAKPKLVKVPKPRVAGDKEEAEKAKLGKEKTAEEIADIRAKNLQRLKAVGAKYARGQYAEGRAGGFTKKQAQEARDYVAAVNDDLESFKSPTFLSMDEVKVLV